MNKMQITIEEMTLMCSIYDADFRNLVKEQQLCERDDLVGNVNLFLPGALHYTEVLQ